MALLGELELDDIRATLISPTGKVVFDTEADASTLPSHADRPEFINARERGVGSSERSSETLGYTSLYEAVLLDSGDVVRLSVDRAGVVAFLFQDLALLVGLAVLLVGVSWLVSRWLSRRFVQPILEIDPSTGDGVAPYVELDPLVSRLNDQHEQLMHRMSEIQDAADLRREFTANVTHELKTPIASISGAAELIRDGIARPEDVPGFAGRIYDDARRLSSLVSDILTLSKLDEAERAGEGARELFGPSESVNLLAVARDVADRLAPKAKRAQVSVSVEGVSMIVRGNPRLLDELVATSATTRSATTGRAARSLSGCCPTRPAARGCACPTRASAFPRPRRTRSSSASTAWTRGAAATWAAPAWASRSSSTRPPTTAPR